MHDRTIALPSLSGRRQRLSDRREADLFLTDLLGSEARAEAWEDSPEPSDAGERFFHVPQLLAHRAAGFRYDLSRDNCVLRWARVSRGYVGPVDVVVHYHGFKSHNRMTLRSKADHSGLDLDLPGVSRPTIGLVPHGRAFNSSTPGMDGFAFPAIDDRAGLFRLVDFALAELGRVVGSSGLRRGRLIVTAHSGGGAALNRLMRSLNDATDVDGFQYFDATYGGAEIITAPRSWLTARLERDARALQGLRTDATRYMEESGGHVRLVGIDPSRTAAVAHQVDAFLDRRVRALVSDSSLREVLRRYYRAQCMLIREPDLHNRVPGHVGGRLLAYAGNDLDGIARNVARPSARSTATTSRSRSEADDSATPGARYRAEVVKAIEQWKGAVEGDAKFTRFRSSSVLEAARKAAGQRGSAPYTTCIEFLLQVQGDAARTAGVKVKPVDARIWSPAERAKLPPGAWQSASPGGAARPKPGDVLYLVFARNVRDATGRVSYYAGGFSHVGIFARSEPLPAALVSATHPANAELWYTVDGGQGTAGRYDAQGRLLAQGQERIDEVRRFYHPTDCQISGERIQGDRDYRTLLGWVDVEQLANGSGR